MEHITYLLGAGASAQSIPIVNKMAEEIKATNLWLNNAIQTGKNMGAFASEDYGLLTNITDDLGWLARICDIKENFSVDTYAKKIKIAGDYATYKRLKIALSIYFTLQQKRVKPDVRYDNFWASILESPMSFPGNIKILSWNYDFQLELTYRDFLKEKSLKAAARTLNVLSHNSSSYDLQDNEGFKVYKLNGSATYNSEVKRNSTNYICDSFDISTTEFLQTLLNWIKMTNNGSVDFDYHLSYAWENGIGSDLFRSIKNNVSQTTILVVVGYSFPYFNRHIDKAILGDHMPNLKKVYFQAPDANNLIERFQNIQSTLPIEALVPKTDIYQFVIPNEL